MTTIKYLAAEKDKLYKTSNSNDVLIELLWGDRVEFLSNNKVNNRYKVKARWIDEGWIDADSLGDESLLEVYFIDVGQGDGVLIVTPERKHILIDGGYKRNSQPHGKSAADFVDWKFYEDYGMNKIILDAMICSHCDADHYGGLWDLINPNETEELDVQNVEIKNFYHAGVSWWKSLSNSRFLGREENGFLHDLLEGETSIQNGLDPNSPLRLQGYWSDFLNCVLSLNPTPTINRLAYNPASGFNYLPGFEANEDIRIKILGPIETTNGGPPKLKDLGGRSQNTNGNSILMRLDYGRVKILLTGDLNKKSQQYILDTFTGNRQELAADVIKGCHHGSDDCSYEFLECVNASATVISSGDDETHAHPRPNIVAASGVTGFKKIHNDELITPLIYSTEIARSIKLGDPYEVLYDEYESSLGEVDVLLTDELNTKIKYTRSKSGALNPSKKTKSMEKLKVVDGIVYGLVNVRTDGSKILCATMNEGKAKWDIKTFDSRF